MSHAEFISLSDAIEALCWVMIAQKTTTGEKFRRVCQKSLHRLEAEDTVIYEKVTCLRKNAQKFRFCVKEHENAAGFTRYGVWDRESRRWVKRNLSKYRAEEVRGLAEEIIVY